MNVAGVIFTDEDIEQMERVALNDAIYGMEHAVEPNGLSWAEEGMRILARLMTREVLVYDFLSLSDLADGEGLPELSEKLYDAFEALIPFHEEEQ